MMEQNGNGATDGLQFDEETCERYLFGELTEAEQERFETAYFNDDVFFDRFMAVKTELLDLYARGELDSEKRARMEPHFLATAPRAKRLAESREFIQVVTSIAERDRPTVPIAAAEPAPTLFESLTRFFTLPRLAAAGVLLIATVGGFFLLSRVGRDGIEIDQAGPQPTPNESRSVDPPSNSVNNAATSPQQPEVAINPANANREAPGTATPPPKSEVATEWKNRQTDPSPKETNRSVPDKKQFAVDTPPSNDSNVTIPGPDVEPEPSITLTGGATRAVGEGNTLTLPIGKDRPARIALVFRSDRYEKYIVTINTVAGGEIFRKDNYNNRAVSVTSDGSRRLVVRLSTTSVIEDKDYIIKLEGRSPGGPPETIEEFYFRARRANPLKDPR